MKQGSTINSITTGNLTFYYDEKEAIGNGIQLTNSLPTSDDVGKGMMGSNQVFDFQVVADAVGEDIFYEVTMDKQESSTLSGNHVKVYLTTIEGSLEQEVANSMSGGEVKTYTEYDTTEVKDAEGKTLYQENIPNGTSDYEKNFRLRMWISEDATSVVGGKWAYSEKEFSIKVNVYANPETEKLPVMKNGFSAKEGFYADEYRTNVATITVSDHISIPESGVVAQWDMSEEANGSVMAWVTTNEENSEFYDLVIAGKGGVAINQNATEFFREFINLKEANLKQLDTSEVSYMDYMFFDCSSLTSLDLSNFDTSRVTDMYSMFSWCSSLTSLDLSNFDTSQVTSMNSMFSGCSSLTSLDLSNFDTSQVTNMRQMFDSCKNLTLLDLSSFDTSRVTDMYSMFSWCSSLTSLDLSNFDTSQVTNMRQMFNSCKNLTLLDLSNFDTSRVTNMDHMFSSCSSLTSLDLSNFDTSQVTNMRQMFNSCKNLTLLDLSNFDTSRVTNMDHMFSSCSSLTSLDLSSFDTSRVTNMDRMFSSCSSLTSLDLSNFDTSQVTNMGGMFDLSTSLTSLDLSSFDFSQVLDIGFYYVSATIYVKDEAAKSFIEDTIGYTGGPVLIAA